MVPEPRFELGRPCGPRSLSVSWCVRWRPLATMFRMNKARIRKRWPGSSARDATGGATKRGAALAKPHVGPIRDADAIADQIGSERLCRQGRHPMVKLRRHHAMDDGLTRGEGRESDE